VITSVDDRRSGVRRDADFSLGQLLRVAHLRASSAMLAGTRPLGLELRHVAVLVGLGAQGPLTQRDLGRAAGLDKATLARVTDDLVEAGLAVRRVHHTDRRSRLVSLTPEGERALARLRLLARDVVADLTGGMAPDRAALLVELLAELCGEAP
jgi:MarR family transcriptional regulator, lower aerobic nicotinate degradation pathway regulator